MESSDEIRNIIKNVRYYTSKLQELIKVQFEKDVDTGHILGINTNAGSIRFDSLGAMQVAIEWISIYCENIETNLKSAEKQDEKLRLPDKEEQEPEYEKEAATPEEFR